MPNDTTHLLNLTTSDGWPVSVPVRLPDAITFDWFLPGRGVMSACVHPTTLDPSSAKAGEVETWNPSLSREEKRKKQVRYYDEKDGRWWWRADTSLDLTTEEEEEAREQAEEVLFFVVERLLRPSDNEQDGTLRLIAEMAHAEAVAWESWEKLPQAVKDEVRRMGPIPHSRAKVSAVTPSVAALAAYVDVLTEEAQKAAATSARALLERQS